MSKHSFGKKTYDTLIKSGWFEGRNVDVERYTKLYKEEGFPVLNSAISFLREFGGLNVQFKNLRNGIMDDFTFDVVRALELEVRERVVDDYEPRIGYMQMCLIGTAYREHFVLLMDTGGRVFGGYDSNFVKIADSGEEAIEAIINDYAFEEIE